MSMLSGLLDWPTREPAACVIKVGKDGARLGALNALIKSIEIATSRTEAAAATILFEDRRTEDGSYMVADAELFGRWQPISLTADFTSHQEEILRGYVVGLKPSYPASGGEVSIEVSILDESALLDREQIRTVWGQEEPMSDKAIIGQLLSGTGIVLDPACGQGQAARSLNQDSTPLKFMRQRAKANGYELLFTPETLYFGPKRLEGEAQATIMVYAGKATNCLSFGIEDDGLKPDAVAFETAPENDGAVPDSEVVKPALSPLGSSPAAEEGKDLSQPFIQKLSREGDEPVEVARVRAQSMVDEASFKLRASGELDGALYGHVLRPGLLVPVDGTGERYGGLYYTDKVIHRFTEDGYRQSFELLRNATGPGGGAALAALAGPLRAGASNLSSLI